MANKVGNHIVTYVYVDASNLYGGISDLLPHGQYIDFSSLVDCMKQHFPIHKIKAYGTYMPDDPSAPPTRQLFIKAQSRFFQSVRSTPQVEFHKGYLSKTSGKEKGIDVKMAVDILKDAYEGSYKQAVVVTGDDDFLYAIQCVRKIKLPVHLASFASRFPVGISHNTNRRVVYDFNNHFKDKVLPSITKPPQNIEIIDFTSSSNVVSV